MKKEIRLTLLGEPKSTNNIYKSVCRSGFPSVYMSKDGKDLKAYYIEQASEQYKGVPQEYEVSMEVNLYHGTKRRTDIDNFNKILFDSLTGIIWLDDSQIMSLTITKHYDKDNPRIELIINERK